MSDVSPINSYAHLSGEPPGSPEQGSKDPKSTALELPEQEGHNLLEDHILPLTPLKLDGGGHTVSPHSLPRAAGSGGVRAVSLWALTGPGTALRLCPPPGGGLFQETSNY